jgi:hypothetical protein
MDIQTLDANRKYFPVRTSRAYFVIPKPISGATWLEHFAAYCTKEAMLQPAIQLPLVWNIQRGRPNWTITSTANWGCISLGTWKINIHDSSIFRLRASVHVKKKICIMKNRNAVHEQSAWLKTWTMEKCFKLVILPETWNHSLNRANPVGETNVRNKGRKKNWGPHLM